MWAIPIAGICAHAGLESHNGTKHTNMPSSPSVSSPRQHGAPPSGKSPTRIELIALITSSAFFMEMLDATIMAPAIPHMARSFNAQPVELSSGLAVYLLTVATLIPASSWLADRFGARTTFAIAIAIFTIASVMCGLSQSVTQFTIARMFQGIGGALMSPVGRIEVLRRAEKPQLLRVMALLTWPGLTALALGPLLGGFITTYLSWHWIFFINIPLGLFGITMVLIFFDRGTTQDKRPFDALGLVLNGAAMAALLYAIEHLSHGDYTWPSFAIAGLGLVLGVLAVRRAFSHHSPLLPLDALKVETFNVCAAKGGMAFRLMVGGSGFMLPLMFQVGLGYDAAMSGILMFVYLGGDLFAKLLANQVVRKVGFRNVLLYTSILIALSTLGIALFDVGTSLWLMFAVLFVSGLIRSIQFTALSSLSFADVPQNLISSASTLSSMFMQLGFGVGVSLAAALINLATYFSPTPGGQTSLFDLKVAIALSAILPLIAFFSYIRVPAHVGAEISGHAPQPTRNDDHGGSA